MSRTNRKRTTVADEWLTMSDHDTAGSEDKQHAPATSVQPRPRNVNDARALQTQLARRWSLPATPKRWSSRRSLAFIVVASVLLWGVIGWAGVSLVAWFK